MHMANLSLTHTQTTRTQRSLCVCSHYLIIRERKLSRQQSKLGLLLSPPTRSRLIHTHKQAAVYLQWSQKFARSLSTWAQIVGAMSRMLISGATQTHKRRLSGARFCAASMLLIQHFLIHRAPHQIINRTSLLLSALLMLFLLLWCWCWWCLWTKTCDFQPSRLITHTHIHDKQSWSIIICSNKKWDSSCVCIIIVSLVCALWVSDCVWYFAS